MSSGEGPFNSSPPSVESGESQLGSHTDRGGSYDRESSNITPNSPADVTQRRWAPRSAIRNTQEITTSRSYNSTNWRAKADQGVREHRTNASVLSHDENDSLAPQAIAEGRRLYVGNMPYMAKGNDVEVLFMGSGYKVERIDISIDPFTGRNPSYCFVELATKEEADRAMLELNGRELLGRPVNIRPGIAKSTRNRPQGRMDIFAQNEKKQLPSVFDRWEETEAQRRGYSDQGRRLYVGGLPRMPDQATVTELIRNFFQGFTIDAISKIISPHPSKRSQPGNHYYLFVDFPTAEEADAAIKTLNGRTFPWGGRAIVSKARGESRKLEERDIWEESYGTG